MRVSHTSLALVALMGVLCMLALSSVHGASFHRFRPRNDRSPYDSVEYPEAALHRVVGSVVMMGNEHPIEGASVHVVRDSGLKVYSVRLERTHRFDFSFDATPGGYFVQAYVDGYTMGQTYVELTADNLRDDVVVRLSPWSIHGTVRGSDELHSPIPIEGASVQLLQLDKHNILPPTPFGSPFVTLANGKFFFNVINGHRLSQTHRYALEVTPPTGWTSIAQMPVPALPNGQQKVQVDPVVFPFTISGQVRSVDDGSAAPGASVQLMNGASPVGDPTVVGADGLFLFNFFTGHTLDFTVAYTLDVTAPDQWLTWVDVTAVSVPAMTNDEPVATVNPAMELVCVNGGTWSSAFSYCSCVGSYEGRWCEDSPPGCYIDTDIMYLALTPRVQGVIEEHSISDATPFTLALPKTDVGEDITCTNSDASESTCVVSMVPLMMRYVRAGDAVLVVSPENKVKLHPVLTMGHKIDEFKTMQIATVNFRRQDGSEGFIDLTTNHMLHVRTPAGSVGDVFEAGTGAMDMHGYSGALSNSRLQLAATLQPGQQIWIQEFPAQSPEMTAECSAIPATTACVTGASLPVFRAAEVVSVVMADRSVVVQEPIVLDTSVMVVNGMVASQLVGDVAYAFGLVRAAPAFATHFTADPLWAYRALEAAIVSQAALTPEWIDITQAFRNAYQGILAAHMQWLASLSS